MVVLRRKFWRRMLCICAIFLGFFSSPAGAADDYFDAPASYGGPKHTIIAGYGIEYDMQTGGAIAPDSYQYDYTITPDSGAGVSQVIICQSPYQNSLGNNEPSETTLTWPGGGSAVVYDPNNQISSHANGAIIT